MLFRASTRDWPVANPLRGAMTPLGKETQGIEGIAMPEIVPEF